MKTQSHFKLAPSSKLTLIILLGLFSTLAAIFIATEEKVANAILKSGMSIESRRGSLTLETLDFTAEPGEIENRTELKRFYERQEILTQILSEDMVSVFADGKKKNLRVHERTLAELSPLFWIQVFVGVGALIFSGWIWALRSREIPITFFFLSGLSTFISAMPSAIYTTRELAIPETSFKILEALNIIGAAAFGVSMIGLFLVYPVRLYKWKTLVIAQSIILTLWTIIALLQWIPYWASINLIIVVAMLSICLLIGIQFYSTKHDPVSRASLTWLGLSVIMGAGAFVVFNTVPLILETPPMNQGYAFAFFLIIYLGLAAGLSRYKLFEVGQWAFRFLYYAVGAIVFVLLDAALVYFLRMDRFPALGVSLIVIGFFYVPLRDYFWNLFSKNKDIEPHKLLSEALHVAFAVSASERAARWMSLLRMLFDPLEILEIEKEVKEVRLDSEGLSLSIPSVASSPSLILRYPWQGRSLYSVKSLELAKQIIFLIEQAESSRDAYDRGVTQERKRMAQDLHDDVGARLLTGIYLADDKLRPTLQGVVADIRTIVSGISGERVTLGRLLADIRHEASRRLSSAQIELIWPLLESDEEEKILDYRQQKAIGSAIREIISNVIRHSEATRFEVTIAFDEKSLLINLKDNGKGLPAENIHQGGHGMKNIQRRLEELGGKTSIISSPIGLSIQLIIPRDLPL